MPLTTVNPALLDTQAQYTGFKNRIIDGGFTVWQRGTSFSGVTPSLGVPAYTADRWYVAQLTSQSATDVTQQTTGATRFAIRVQKRVGSSGASTNILGQEIENLNCLDLPGQQVTLSFTARAGANYSATSNALLVQIFTCTTADQSTQNFVNGTAAGQATLLSQNVTLTTSNQRFTLTTNAVPSNATNVCLQFVEASSASAAGANDWFEVSDVQIEKGNTATSFDYRPYGTELALCQRYFETGSVWKEGTNAGAGNQCVFTETFKVVKRANATFTFGNVNGANANITSISGPEAMYEWISPFNQSNLTTGFAFRFVPSSATSTMRQYWTASSEL
jgi:hypothetical protein